MYCRHILLVRAPLILCVHALFGSHTTMNNSNITPDNQWEKAHIFRETLRSLPMLFSLLERVSTGWATFCSFRQIATHTSKEPPWGSSSRHAMLGPGPTERYCGVENRHWPCLHGLPVCHSYSPTIITPIAFNHKPFSLFNLILVPSSRYRLFVSVSPVHLVCVRSHVRAQPDPYEPVHLRFVYRQTVTSDGPSDEHLVTGEGAGDLCLSVFSESGRGVCMMVQPDVWCRRLTAR